MEADISARGIDIPTVDWILQTDCNVNVETNVHRVGRTAKLILYYYIYIFLFNSDVQMKANLLLLSIKNDCKFKRKKIPISKTFSN